MDLKVYVVTDNDDWFCLVKAANRVQAARIANQQYFDGGGVPLDLEVHSVEEYFDYVNSPRFLAFMDEPEVSEDDCCDVCDNSECCRNCECSDDGGNLLDDIWNRINGDEGLAEELKEYFNSESTKTLVKGVAEDVLRNLISDRHKACYKIVCDGDPQDSNNWEFSEECAPDELTVRKFFENYSSCRMAVGYSEPDTYHERCGNYGEEFLLALSEKLTMQALLYVFRSFLDDDIYQDSAESFLNSLSDDPELFSKMSDIVCKALNFNKFEDAFKWLGMQGVLKKKIGVIDDSLD